ncbi:MAG: NAD(+) synthase [Planctomycetaceae bacterium]|nr:NAD(+) synthase [Planctomycetaceae bacterium]|tara:strand:+ start:2337 stop:4280 length:1944 start_codon:yes stop_codon:yes gene_type:complete
MKRIKLAAAALNQTPIAWNQNYQNILSAIEQAKAQQADLLCLPELCVSGYGCEDAFMANGVLETSLHLLEQLIPQTQGIAVTIGLPMSVNGHTYNAVAMVTDGKLLGFAAKQNLAGDGLHYEPRWFTAWLPNEQITVNVAGNQVPFGDVTFWIGGVHVGFEICEDAWIEERPAKRLASRDVGVILNPSASHFAFGKHQLRRRLLVAGSQAIAGAYVYANLVGNEAGRAIYDGDTMIGVDGTVVASGSRFSYRDVVLTTAVVDVKTLESTTAITSEFEFGEHTEPAVTSASEVCAWEKSQALKEEEFARSLSLALFDYMRKSGSHGFVLSLSGGADSATVAVLVKLMIDFAVQDIGLSGVAQRLGHCFDSIAPDSSEKWVGELLWCVYQATRNSSEITRDAAANVAKAIGARFYELNVDGVVQQYKSLVSNVLERELTWDRDDLALQNIQARGRAPSVWMLANIKCGLLLATSNRSEAAVGYTTMDGDTCGGISPIAGIDKAFLRQWLRWLEKQGPHGGEPIAALVNVNQQQPTAELRPPAEKQTDESDLMPYEILDLIERLAIRDKLMPQEILDTLTGHELTAEYEADREQVITWVKKFFQLWSRNQWKRERFAPSFHVDDENLDPKTWCRFPILSGGFCRELDALE